MQYRYLFFDMDNTLFDFDADEDQALAQLFKDQGVQLTPTIKTTYQTFNQNLWRQYEEGTLTREILLNTRFATFFKEQFNQEVDGPRLSQNYLDNLALGHDLMPQAEALIVGDSLTSDVQGGQNVGVATAWYNPNQLANQMTDIQPTHEIEHLMDLLAI
ncbi:HAD hydrolase-like protein [Latilactobacillus curvatus]|uniref:HAD hydrolase-like protein n=1 Tax=Latilactobacillus curvatus TaxID=28038 RepID=UPI003CE67A97